MSHGELLSLLRDAQSGFTEGAWRLFPAAFSPEEPALTGYPAPLSWEWRSCADTIGREGAQGVMMRLPLWWQLETPLRKACDSAKAFVFINDQGNMPLGAAAVRTAGIDLVVTDLDDAARFAAYLKEQGIRLPSFLTVEPVTQPLVARPAALNGAQLSREMHIVPGVPALVQCGSHAAGADARFHLAEDFHAALSPSSTCVAITGRPRDLVPIQEYELPAEYALAGHCECGKQTISAQPYA